MSILRRIWWFIRHAVGGCHMSRCEREYESDWHHNGWLTCRDCGKRFYWPSENA